MNLYLLRQGVLTSKHVSGDVVMYSSNLKVDVHKMRVMRSTFNVKQVQQNLVLIGLIT